MGDLTRGETFASGEIVSAARLHKLVEDATINTGAIGTSHIADGAVTAAKLDGAITVTAAQVTLANGKVPIGNASGIGVATSLDSTTLDWSTALGVKDAGITAAKLAADAVETAKIKDLNVTGAKLETLSPSPSGSYGSSTLIPVLTVDSKGRVTAASTIAVTTVTKASGTASIPAAGGLVSFSHGLGVMPSMVAVYLECLVDTLGYRANTGSGNPDRIPIDHVFSGAFVPGFTVNITDAAVEVIRYAASSTQYVFRRTSGGVGLGNYDEITTNIGTNWRLRIFAWV